MNGLSHGLRKGLRNGLGNRLRCLPYKRVSCVSTVEISLLMPFILGIIFCIMTLAYFEHDRIVFSRACIVSSLRMSQRMQDKQESDRSINNTLVQTDPVEDEVRRRLLGKWEWTHTDRADRKECFSEFGGRMRSLGGFSRLLYSKGYAVQYRNEIEVFNPEDRVLRRISGKG